MSVEVLEESGAEVDARRIAKLSRFVLERLRVHPQAELCIKLTAEAGITQYNEKWMGQEGPTDVLSFPMDELRPGTVNDEPEEGILGDLILCPQVAERQAADAQGEGHTGYTTTVETLLLTLNRILHLLGYDHAEPEEHREMFGLQARLPGKWQAIRPP